MTVAKMYDRERRMELIHERVRFSSLYVFEEVEENDMCNITNWNKGY